jgi:hypothetical protein
VEIVIKLPQEIEVASLDYNAGKREIRITPLFVSSGASALLAFVQVVGDGGASLKSALRVSSNSGQIAVKPLTTSAAKFDKLGADEEFAGAMGDDEDDDEDDEDETGTAISPAITSVLDAFGAEDGDVDD